MDRQRYLADVPPPTNRLPFWKLVRTPPAPGWLEFTIVSAEPITVNVHQTGETPIPCPGVGCTYPGCPKGRRWQAYFQGLCKHVNGVAILELTYEPYEQVHLLTLGNDQSFRGLVIRLERMSKKVNAPIRVTPVSIVSGVRALPDEVDLWRFLERLWKLDR